MPIFEEWKVIKDYPNIFSITRKNENNWWI